MTPDEVKQGKQRVRSELIDPLEAMGCKPPKGTTLEAHQTALDKIAARLCHHTDGDLLIIRETVIDNLSKDGRWPKPAVVIGLANMLRKPPLYDSEKIVNLVRWGAGRADIQADQLPALYRWLKRHNRPPGEVDLRQIRDAAREDDAWEHRMREVAKRAQLGSHEKARMDWLVSSRQRVDEILIANRGAGQ